MIKRPPSSSPHCPHRCFLCAFYSLSCFGFLALLSLNLATIIVIIMLTKMNSLFQVVWWRDQWADEDDNVYADDDVDHDEQMIWYIYNGEVSVCQQKSLFLYSKDLGVSHVYRHLSLFKSVWKPKKRPNPLKKSFLFLYSKAAKVIISVFKGFGCFSCF